MGGGLREPSVPLVFLGASCPSGIRCAGDPKTRPPCIERLGGTPRTVGAVAPAGHRTAGPLGLWGDAVHPGGFTEP